MKRPRGTTEGVREALYPISSHNPDVQEQRPGACVEVNGRFLCEPRDTENQALHAGYGWAYGFCGPRGKAIVWSSAAAAQSAAERVNGVVVTVPRFNGYCVVWGPVGV